MSKVLSESEIKEIEARQDHGTYDEYCCYSREYDVQALIESHEALRKRVEFWKREAIVWKAAGIPDGKQSDKEKLIEESCKEYEAKL